MSHEINRSLNRNFLTRYLLRNLAEVLPRRAKRMLYICSAAGVLLKTRTPDLKLVNRLNKELHLASRDSGLLFPVYMGNRIWEDVQEEQVDLEYETISVAELEPKRFTDVDCWKTALFFAKNTPFWLQYGSQQLMTTDIHDLLMSLKRNPA